MVDYIIFSCIQVIGEVLPISSSGHLALYESFALYFFSYHLGLPPSFDHILHGPTLLVVLYFFFPRWASKLGRALLFLVGWDSSKRAAFIVSRILNLAVLVIVADLITAAFYFTFGGSEDIAIKLAEPQSLAFGFFVTLLALFSLRGFRENYKAEFVSFRASHAILMGLAQGFALFPGVSRFVLTYWMARVLCFSPRRSLELSFLIFTPLMAAGFLHGLYALYELEMLDVVMRSQFLLAIAGATIVSYVLFSFIYRLILKGRIWRFGFYMVIPLALAVFNWFIQAWS